MGHVITWQPLNNTHATQNQWSGYRIGVRGPTATDQIQITDGAMIPLDGNYYYRTKVFDQYLRKIVAVIYIL